MIQMAFQFRLRTVLKVRQLERDQQRQVVSNARACLTKVVADRDRLVDGRMIVIDELRRLNDSEVWDINHVLDRQRHTAQLGQALAATEFTLTKAKTQLEAAITRLVEADQLVKALERISERQLAEYEVSQLKLAALE